MKSSDIDNLFFRTAVDQCNDLVVITDSEAKIIYVNPAFEKHTGYLIKNIKGKNISIVKSGNHKSLFYKSLWQCLKKGKPKSTVFINKKKNGELYYENKTITPIFNKEGRIQYYLSTSKDVTAELKLQKQIIKQNNFVNTVIQNTEALILCLDFEGRITFFNKACEKLTGYKFHEVIERKFYDVLVPKKDRIAERKTFEGARNYKFKINNHESYWLTKKGKPVLISWSNSVIKDENNVPNIIMSTGKDISKERENESELIKLNLSLDKKVKERTDKLNQLYKEIALKNEFITKINSEIPAIVYLIDLRKKTILFFNNQINRNIYFHFDKDTPIPLNKFFKCINNKHDKNIFKKFLIPSPNGIDVPFLIDKNEYWFQKKSISFESKGKKTLKILGFITDITEYKSVQSKLMESQRIAKIGTWEWNIKTSELFWSDEIYRIFEIDPKKFKPSYPRFIEAIHPGDRKLVEDAVSRAIKTKAKYEIVHRLEPSNGRIKYVIEKGFIEHNKKGEPIRMIGTVRDITEAEYMRQRLVESQKLAKIGTWELNLLSFDLMWSEEMYNIHELDKNKFSLTRESQATLIHHEDREMVMNAPIEACANKETFNIEYRIITSENKIKHVVNRGYAEYSTDGTPIRVLGAVQDITEEKNLKNKLMGYFETLENSLNAIFTADLNGRIEYANPAAVKMWGYSDLESMLKEKPMVLDYWMNEEMENIYNCIENIFEQGYFYTEKPFSACKKNGELALIKFNATLIKDDKGNPVSITAAFFDITDKIENEKQLVESEKKYRSIYENALVGIYRTCIKTHKVIDANEVCVKLFGYRSKEDFLENFIPSERYFDPDDMPRLVKLLMEEFSVHNEVVLFKRKDGSTFWGNISVKLIHGLDILEGVILDVTQSKIFEKQLKDNLIEKDLLLKEIHHRVKNNLQIISSLLKLQLNKLEDVKLRRPLIESRERIRAIALIHEKLYLGHDISTIDFSDYLVNLTRPMNTLNNDKKIQIKYNMVEFITDINIAVPLGLACYEIISNSFKHAFDNREGNLLNVNVAKVDNHYEISIVDNGVGFEIGSLNNSKSLGWNLISNLTKQAKSVIEVNSAPGQGSEFKVKVINE